MLVRVSSFFDFFALNGQNRAQGERTAIQAAERAKGMTHLNDYEALSAIALYFRPRQIFEIGTYLGVTSDFFLKLLPKCKVVSIAYRNLQLAFWRKVYNNSELPPELIGSAVEISRRQRFTQLYGDSHKLDVQRILEKYGFFDLVLIDGDHSRHGVRQDTELAKKIITRSGVICWHDANPKPKYMDVRRFLEDDLALTAIATKDEYIGGIACWSAEIDERLKSASRASQPIAPADTDKPRH